MTYTLRLSHRATRFRVFIATFSLFALLAVGCDGNDNLAPESVVAGDLDGVATDSLAITDSLALTDSAVVADSITADSLLAADGEIGIMSAVAAKKRVPFGPFSLWSGYTQMHPEAKNFSASINFTDAYGIVRQIQTARAKGQRLMLMMTDEGRAPYMTRGKFDLAKWKRAMDRYRTTAIRAEVARAVADGTVLGNSVIDEPKHKTWNNSINKATTDQMCRHVKSIFPTLPVGVTVVHWWRPNERYRACDFIVDQYDWAQPSHGWGTRGGGRGDVKAWRTAALAQAKKDGIAIAFSLNILDGGEEMRTCNSRTGGRGTYANHCRMTSKQVRDFGLALGPSGCALFMWRHDRAFMSKSANLQAIRDVAATLANATSRSCARGGAAGVAPPPPPSPSPSGGTSAITLTATGRIAGSAHYMSLKWSGARGTTVDIYRNGARLRTTVNDRSDSNGRTYRGSATYTFKVCERGSSTCSATATVRL